MSKRTKVAATLMIVATLLFSQSGFGQEPPLSYRLSDVELIARTRSNGIFAVVRGDGSTMYEGRERCCVAKDDLKLLLTTLYSASFFDLPELLPVPPEVNVNQEGVVTLDISPDAQQQVRTIVLRIRGYQKAVSYLEGSDTELDDLWDTIGRLAWELYSRED